MGGLKVRAKRVWDDASLTWQRSGGPHWDLLQITFPYSLITEYAGIESKISFKLDLLERTDIRIQLEQRTEPELSGL